MKKLLVKCRCGCRNQLDLATDDEHVLTGKMALTLKQSIKVHRWLGQAISEIQKKIKS